MFFYHFNKEASLKENPINSAGMLFWLDQSSDVTELSNAFSTSGKEKASAFIKGRGTNYIYLMNHPAAQELREKGKLNLQPTTSKPTNISNAKGLIVYDNKNKNMMVYDQFPAAIFKTMKESPEILGNVATAKPKPEPKASATKTETSGSKRTTKKSKATDILKGIWDDLTSCMPHKHRV